MESGALIYRRFPLHPCIYARAQTFVHGRRDKHGKRDTAGHAVHVNTAELRDTAKLKLLSPSWNRAAMRLG